MPCPKDALPRPLVLHIAQLEVEPPRPLSPAFFDPPSTPLCQDALRYVESCFPHWIVNHCLRTYAFALAIASYAGWDKDAAAERLAFDRQGVFLACVLHEVGFNREEAPNSRLSLEFWGAIKAREWILSQQRKYVHNGGTIETLNDYADDTFEAIAMHTLEPAMTSGRARLIPALCALGANQDLLGGLTAFVHRDTIQAAVSRWPRVGYVDGLKAVALDETEKRPGCLFETCLHVFLEPMYLVECFKHDQGVLGTLHHKSS
jgi:cyanamide hydratase family protein with HD domain